ncbi:hypothetical protein CBR_g41443 [Chara braunii]|uniref:Methyltransferase type 11 domain-containing protein n=1 Tax=Chara braunii TaxID=69332 RepID=A0A388LVV0_CHABU|nr:hypothetical protein CBR_g41443 [Chara braunii]|eukprot:GBG86448.1 hypothetical protein CBR_g41443 [Chara braunii]
MAVSCAGSCAILVALDGGTYRSTHNVGRSLSRARAVTGGKSNGRWGRSGLEAGAISGWLARWRGLKRGRRNAGGGSIFIKAAPKCHVYDGEQWVGGRWIAADVSDVRLAVVQGHGGRAPEGLYGCHGYRSLSDVGRAGPASTLGHRTPCLVGQQRRSPTVQAVAGSTVGIASLGWERTEEAVGARNHRPRKSRPVVAATGGPDSVEIGEGEDAGLPRDEEEGLAGETVEVGREAVGQANIKGAADGKEGWKIGGVCPCSRCLASRRSFISGMAKGASVAATSSLPGILAKPAKAESGALLSQPSWYQKLFAYVLANCTPEKKLAEYRKELFPKLNALDDRLEILDLGVGPGQNLRYYAELGKEFHIVGVDPNASMREYAFATAAEVGFPTEKFHFLQGAGEDIPMEDNSVDVVVCTWVLCSVMDPAKTLADGKPLRWLQNILDPLQALLADGCHLTRDTLVTIEAAQFQSVDVKSFTLGSAGPLGPHIMGIATLP